MHSNNNTDVITKRKYLFTYVVWCGCAVCRMLQATTTGIRMLINIVEREALPQVQLRQNHCSTDDVGACQQDQTGIYNFSEALHAIFGACTVSYLSAPLFCWNAI